MDKVPSSFRSLLKMVADHAGMEEGLCDSLSLPELEHISERLLGGLKKTEEEHRLFQDLFHRAPVGYALLDDGGTILRGNACLSSLLGNGHVSLEGRAFCALLQEEDQQRLREALASLASADAPVALEARLRTESGGTVSATVTAQRISPRLTSVTVAETGGKKLVESVLRSQQSELEAVYDNVPLMICLLDDNLRVRYGNRAFRSFLSLSMEDMSTRRIGDLLTCPSPGGAACALGDPGTAIPAVTAETLRDGGGRSARTVCELPAGEGGGRSVVLSVRTARVHLYEQPFALLLLEDNTDRERAETALRDSGALYTSLVENLPQYIIRKDLEGRMTFANRRYCELRGCGLEDLLGKSDFDFFPPALAEKYRKDDLYVIATGASLDEVEKHAAPGSPEMFMQVMKTPVRDARGNITGVQGIFWDITERKTADRVLQESELRLKGLIESIPHVAIQRFTLDGVVEYWNRASEDMYGYSTEEAVGKDLFSLLFSGGEEIEAARAALHRLVQSGESSSHPEEMLMRRKDGAMVPIYSNYVIIRRREQNPEIFCIDVDLSDLKRAEKALRESEMRYRAFLDAAPDLAFLKDSQYRYVFVNRANREFFGRSEADILGKTDHDLMPTETADACRASDEAVLRGGVLQISEERAGSRVCEARKFPIMIGDQEEGIGGFIHDITYRKKLENERLALERDMLHAQKLESLGVMAGGIAHDFNNLLLAVMGNIDLALEDLPEDAEARPSLESAVKAARRGADLTRQILAYSGKTQAQITEVDLNDLVRENAGILATILDKKAVLSLATGAAVPPVMGDPAQIQQVIMNLMTNASESLCGESGTVRLATGVTICSAEQMAGNRTDAPPKPGRYVWLEVSDTGCGMDEETLSRLFDPFFTTKFTGRGLGMSAVLGIMKAHQGAIFVESTPGGGTTTRLLFPPAGDQAAPPAPGGAATAVRAAGDRFSGTALAVDDDETLLQMAERILSRLGFDVITARNGLEALDLLRKHLEEVRVVLLDVTMPVMDGPTALVEIRAMAPQLPVILSSGYDEGNASKGEGADSGPGGFLQKPYRMETLRTELAKILGTSPKM